MSVKALQSHAFKFLKIHPWGIPALGAALFLTTGAIAVSAGVEDAEAKGGEEERWAVPSWGDVVCLFGPGTDASMDSPEALEKTIKRWKARGFNGVTLRSDLADYEPMISRNNSTQQNPRLQLLLDYVDRVSEEFNVLKAAETISEPLGFKMWAWHPHLYSDGAPGDVGTPGLGRMIPWSYSSRYFLDHPEGLTIDREGNKLWMVREYAYPEARSTKVSEFVHMAKELGVKRFLACMRSEVNQLVDPPEKGDQYGFNQPVVDEMKKRYGVDIMTDPRFDVFSESFDIADPMVENWRHLRGEHITQFYRELRRALDDVDPDIQIAVTLSGDYAGPPIGNQRLDWRTWIDEGLVDAIVAPVFFEGSLDHEASQKGYLTHVRDNKGVVPFLEIAEYIKKSDHPEIELISTGATAYFNEPPPPGTDGWRVDVWYELYTSAWYQRWSQWMKDLEERGQIAFILQDFDTFPTDPSQLPPAGSAGLVSYDPKIRACPGGWYPFGDEASGKALIQDTIKHGETGNAIRLTSNGAAGPSLVGYHNADVDRSNISARLDTSITNGKCSYSFWGYRESAQSGVITYLENQGGEMDVGLKIAPETGEVSYTTGRGGGGTGTWVDSGYQLPVGEWQKFTIDVDFKTASYSAQAGPDGGIPLGEAIPYSPPPPRTTMQNGVNVEIEVPTYKSFRQVLFQPQGVAGSSVYVDDVAVYWTPDLVFAETDNTKFLDNFEASKPGTHLADSPAQGGAWSTKPAAPGHFQVIASTSYREGVNSLETTRRGDLFVRPDPPVQLKEGELLAFDVDLFIRSTSGYPSIIPGQTESSRNEVGLILEQAGAGGGVVAEARAASGKWTLSGGDQSEEASISVPYDCWFQLQLAVDLKSRTATLIQQPIGQVAQSLAEIPLPEDFHAGQTLAFRINLGPSNNCVLLDNVKIATAKADDAP